MGFVKVKNPRKNGVTRDTPYSLQPSEIRTVNFRVYGWPPLGDLFDRKQVYESIEDGVCEVLKKYGISYYTMPQPQLGGGAPSFAVLRAILATFKWLRDKFDANYINSIAKPTIRIDFVFQAEADCIIPPSREISEQLLSFRTVADEAYQRVKQKYSALNFDYTLQAKLKAWDYWVCVRFEDTKRSSLNDARLLRAIKEVVVGESKTLSIELSQFGLLRKSKLPTPNI